MAAQKIWILIFSAVMLAGQVSEIPQLDRSSGFQTDDNDPDLPKLVCRMALFAQYGSDIPGADKLVRHGLSLFARNNALETADAAACLTTFAGVLESKGPPKQGKGQLEG